MTTIVALSQALRRREVSPVEITRECLARIEQLNPVLNAFITVTGETALAQARRAEEEILRGQWRGPLHGIPIGFKDLIDTAGILTSAASKLYSDRIPIRNADVVSKLEQAGAVLLGKQNLHEFAYGGSSMISCFGEVHNPWQPEHITGGSSGGSAAAVAARMGYGAIGTDTAGSIREPAALCGVVGLKPTYGRVSARGVIPLSESLDHVGPFATTVADTALLFNAIDTTRDTTNVPAPDFLASCNRSVPDLRVGIPHHYFYEDLDPEVASAVEEAWRVFRTFAREMRDIELHPDADRTLQAVEAYAFHAESVVKTPQLYQPETLRRIKTGENVSPHDHQRKLADLKAARESIRRVFEDVDVFVTPTTPIPAPSIRELEQHPDRLRPHELLLLRNTRPLNVWALPAVSVPCGFTTAGLPIGLQIAGPPGRDDLVLQVAYLYEQATPWHERTPPL